jgi:FPC/CPF motif-containing protein YcgG
LSTSSAAADSSYLGLDADSRLRRLLALPGEQTPRPDEGRIHAALLDKLLGDSFACVAARSAVNRRNYRLGVYRGLGTERTAAALCHDLYEFNHEFDQTTDAFTTFMAAFPTTPALGEEGFEEQLWRQLQAMHEIDAEHYAWSDAVSANPDSAEFSFSIGGKAFFIVGLHPEASRVSRTTPWPVIVFNPHAQFERLRAKGKYEGMQAAIRARDVALQGSINPMLSDFGDRSETRQYAGRHVAEDWQCPFQKLSARSDAE